MSGTELGACPRLWDKARLALIYGQFWGFSLVVNYLVDLKGASVELF